MTSPKRILPILLLLSLGVACGDDDVDPGGDAGTTDDAGATPPAPGEGVSVATAAVAAIDGTPGASGFVTVLDDSGSLTLNFSDSFMQGMGPGDTQVRLAKSGAEVTEQLAADPDSVSDSIGTIANGATGAQSFALPAGVTLADYPFVIVWCPTAEINFGVGEFAAASVLSVAAVEGTPGASGDVSIAALEGGGYSVTLSAGFTTGEGPGDTQLLFAQSADEVVEQREADAASVSGVVGTIPNGFSDGPLTFEVPSDIDPKTFSNLIIWCPTAEINFGTAPLG